MAESNFKGRRPDFKGDGVAVWVKQDKNNKPFLSIKMLGSVNVTAFQNTPKEEAAAPKVEAEPEFDMNKLTNPDAM